MFESLFLTHSSLQAVVVISLICAVGLIFGKVRVWGVSLGVTFVFFAGIVAGHFGVSIDSLEASFKTLGVQDGLGIKSLHMKRTAFVRFKMGTENNVTIGHCPLTIILAF